MKLVSWILCLLASAPLFAQQDRSVTIESGGRTRTFTLHLPSLAPAPGLPLLLCYHGSGGSSASMKTLTGFNALADQYGFIVAYPQGAWIKNTAQWNCYVDGAPGHGGLKADDAPDDVQFTRDIIGRIALDFGADTGRVYAAGFSNGGYMCYALSMLASDAIRGIAPVAADMWTDDAYLDQILTTGAARPMPVMHVHGTADNVVAYPDRDGEPNEYGEYPLFVAGRVCDAHTYSSTTSLMTGVDKLVFCPPPVEVCLIRIEGMGHTWTNGAYQTSREIVRFFGLDRTAASVAATAEADRSLTVAPNPARGVVRLHLPARGRIRLVSPAGALLYSADHDAGPVDISTAGTPCGICLVEYLPAGGTATTRSIMVTR